MHRINPFRCHTDSVHTVINMAQCITALRNNFIAGTGANKLVCHDCRMITGFVPRCSNVFKLTRFRVVRQLYDHNFGISPQIFAVQIGIRHPVGFHGFHIKSATIHRNGMPAHSGIGQRNIFCGDLNTPRISYPFIFR